MIDIQKALQTLSLEILDERGNECPQPVIHTLQKIRELLAQKKSCLLRVLVDNDIAAQNVLKLCASQHLQTWSSCDNDDLISIDVYIEYTEHLEPQSDELDSSSPASIFHKQALSVHAHNDNQVSVVEDGQLYDEPQPDQVVVINSSVLGTGDEKLGAKLLGSFLFTVSQAQTCPEVLLLYNSGVRIACEGSLYLDDLLELQARGTKILSCGLCLDYYGLSDTLRVGSVTNMYEIYHYMSVAQHLINPC